MLAFRRVHHWWRSLATATGIVLAAGTLAVSSVSAGASTSPPTTPVVTLIGPTGETINLVPDPQTSGAYSGPVDVLVQDSGQQVFDAQLSVFGDPTASNQKKLLLSSSRTFSLTAESVTPIAVTISVDNPRANTVTVVLSVLQPPGVAPASETFKLLRHPSALYTWLPLVIAGLFGMIFILFSGFYWLREVKRRKAKTGWGRWKFSWDRRVYLPANATGGSWLTLLTGLGAVLGVVLGTTGLIGDAFPGTDIERFVTLNIVFGAVVIAGPVITSAWSGKDRKESNAAGPSPARPRAIGLLCGSSVSLVGMTGLLAALAELAQLSNAATSDRIAMIVGAIFGGVLLFVYAFQSLKQLFEVPAPSGRALQTGETVSFGSELSTRFETVQSRSAPPTFLTGI